MLPACQRQNARRSVAEPFSGRTNLRALQFPANRRVERVGSRDSENYSSWTSANSGGGEAVGGCVHAYPLKTRGFRCRRRRSLACVGSSSSLRKSMIFFTLDAATTSVDMRNWIAGSVDLRVFPARRTGRTVWRERCRDVDDTERCEFNN